jgi:predicted outer membrane repeat protein
MEMNRYTFCAIFCFFLLLLHAESRAQSERYVSIEGDDLDGSNDCLGPVVPCLTISHAIGIADEFDMVNIEKGTYTETIVIEKAIFIKGAGVEETIIQAHEEPGMAESRVVTIVGEFEAGISHVTIRHGRAIGDSPDNQGGGIYNDGSVLTLTGVTLSNNSANLGGGMFTRNSSPVITDVVFDGNSAIGIGGGVYNLNGSPSSTNVIFNNNSADNVGGGIYNEQGNAIFTDVYFTGNNAGTGGGMYNWNSSPELNDVVFEGNSAGGGGGIYSAFNSSPALTNVLIRNNTANSDGGGMYNFGGSPDFNIVIFDGNSARSGGGIYNSNSTPTFNVVDFINNTANINGGGMYNSGSSPTFTSVMFTDNAAQNFGGGIYNTEANPAISSVRFEDNSASSGGGMYNDNSNPTLLEVIFTNNTVVVNGGGMYTTGNPILTDVEFSVNSGRALYSPLGSPSLLNVHFIDNPEGGMYSSDGSPTLENIIFQGNTADNGGGLLLNNSDAVLRNVRFIENQASGNGGGMHTTGSNPALTNVLLNGNSATRGGGLYNTESSVTIINGTINDNETTILGGGIYNDNNIALTLTNSILWNNRIFTDTPSPAQSIVNEGSSVSDISYSLIEHSGGSGESWINSIGTDGGNNIDTDPLFTGAEDVRLLSDSPAINAGYPFTSLSSFPTDDEGNPVDLDGNPRRRHDVIDMGAYEYQGYDIPPFGMQIIINDEVVDHNGYFDFGDTHLGDTSSVWMNFRTTGFSQITISSVILDGDNTQDFSTQGAFGGTFAGGIFSPGGGIGSGLNFKPTGLGTRTAILEFISNDGSYIIHLIGRGTVAPFIQPLIDAASDGDVIVIPPGTYNEAIDFKGKGIHVRSSDGPEATIIDATGLEMSVVSFTGGERPGSILEGFTITGGTGTVANPLSRGGGIYIIDSNPTIRNCIITGNSASAQGGGMFNNRSNPTLTGVIFSENTAVDGGGMINNNSNPVLNDVNFQDNRAISRGGGMYNAGSSPVLRNVMISGNRVSGIGGGMYNENSTVTLTGSVFLGNYADESQGSGGGMYNKESIINITNVTFSGNRAAIGAAMYNIENSNLTLSNVIIWNNLAENNSASPFASMFNGSSSVSTVTYSLIANSGGSGDNWNDAIGVDGGNNIDGDPMFVHTPDPLDAPASTGDVRLLPGSPAINAGDPDTDLTLFSADNGLPVDHDGNPRVRQDRIDMGAYEYQELAAPQLVSPADGEEIDGDSVTLRWYSVTDADSYYVQVSLSGESFEEPHFTAITSDTLIVVSYLDPQTNLYWRVKAHNNNIFSDWSDVRCFVTTTTTSALLRGGLPTEYLLHQNYPNPFNPSTVIRYEIPAETYVLLEVYNILGQRVALLVDGYQQAGYYTVHFHAEHLTSGTYFYRVTAGDFTAVRKFMLVR